MKNIYLFSIIGSLLLFFAGCEDSKKGRAPAPPFDSSKPIVVTGFSPDSSGIGEKMVIKGTNFGNDISKIKVVFKGNKEAKVIAANGDMIYCLVPKQPGGETEIEVKVQDRTTTYQSKKFNYLISELLSTVVGKPGEGGTNSGTLGETRFEWVTGVACVVGNNLITTELNGWRVRLVSLDDNKVILLMNLPAGTPEVTRDKKTVYVVESGGEHAVYKIAQVNQWIPRKIGRIPQAQFSGNIQMLVLDPTEEWLTFRTSNGAIGRMNIADPSTLETLNPNDGGLTGSVNHFVYHPQMNCYLMSIEFEHGIWKVSLDGLTVEKFAGFNGSGSVDGPRLGGAQISHPEGMDVDRDGNIYVGEVRAHKVRKISYPDGMVTTIAGTGTQGDLDGPLDKAQLNGPWDISIDDDGNFYISEYYGFCVRKLAIE